MFSQHFMKIKILVKNSGLDDNFKRLLFINQAPFFYDQVFQVGVIGQIQDNHIYFVGLKGRSDIESFLKKIEGKLHLR